MSRKKRNTGQSSLKKYPSSMGGSDRLDSGPFWNGKAFFLGLFALILLIIPYFKGLFFDSDMIYADIVVSGLSLLVLAFNWSGGTNRLFQTPMPYLLFAILIVYFLGAVQGIVPSLAYDEAFRWVTYFLAFSALVLLIDGRRESILLHGLFLSMLWVSLFGVLAHFGIVTYQDAILGTRISSVLQYPNTYASVVAALTIGILFYASGRIGWAKGFLVTSLYTLFLPALLIAFVYSQSRAVWLLFPLVWFFALFFLNLKQQLHFILTTILMAGVSFSLLPYYDAAVKAKQAGFLLLLLGAGMIGALLTAGLALLLKRWEKAPDRLLNRLLFPALLFIGGVLLFTLIQTPAVVKMLPGEIQGRLSDINLTTRSVAERGTFYEDSLALFRDHWLIGAGGNAWKGVFLKYETLPYYSSQTHSFPMKVLVDTGVIGSLLFLAFFGLIIYTLIRLYRQEGFSDPIRYRTGLPLVVGGMLFLHSLFDFDMSYGYYVLLFISFLALLYAEGERYGVTVTLPYLGEYRGRHLLPWMKGGFLLISFFPFLFMLLFGYAQSIPVNQLTAQEAISNTARKVALKPVSVEYRLMRMDILGQIGRQSGDEKLLQEGFAEGERILSLDRYNPQTYLKVASFFGQHGEGIRALAITEKALENGDWFLPSYEQYIAFAAQIALTQLQQGKNAEAEPLLNKIAALLQKIEEKRAILDKQIESQRYPEFTYTEPIRRYGGEALILLGQYDKAVSLLDPLKGSADPATKEDAFLWLSLAKEKMGLTGEVSPLVEEGKKLNPDFEKRREEMRRLLAP